MDIRDFEGLTKFKLIIPALYIISWVCMILAPSFFPVVYQRFCIGLLIYLDIKIAWVFLTMAVVLVKSWPLITRAKEPAQTQQYSSLTDLTEEVNFGFIIPNFKEEIELLSETLEVLAAHKRAKSHYLIFLAMEAHEEGSELKAQRLIQKFKGYFRVIEYTLHHIRVNEQKGKASNVSWCAENLEPIFEKHMIDSNSVMLTILDADSWAPDIYFELLEEKAREEWEQRHERVYQPIQIFTRNNLDVPVFTRVYDILHSFAHMSNVWSSCFDLTYPLSNYTLSYNLAKRIGFWDTCADAIGEDFHTMMKALWKTSMEVKGRPIYVPFNQVNICTGNGYCADVKARFWQAERHAKGVADVAYCTKMLLTTSFRAKGLLLYWFVFETFAAVAIFPWLVISMNYQNKILFLFEKPSPEIFTENAVSYLFTIMSVLGTVAYLLYEIVKRRANRIIYKQENESILRLL
jgi:hypothetical protein